MSRLSSIINPTLGAAVVRPVLDEESQALAIQASMESLAEVHALSSEMDRMEDTATGLENLAFVADQIQGATKIEMSLIDIAGDLAYAGTGVSGAVMTPGLESAEGDVISTEGIKSIAKSVWKAIKDFVKKLWKHVDNFFHKIFGTLPRLRKALVALKDRADKMADKAIEEPKTEIGSSANALAVGYDAPSNGAALLGTLDTTNKVVNSLFDVYTRAMIARGEKIKAGLKEYKPEKNWDASRHATQLAKVFNWRADWTDIKKGFDTDSLGKGKDRRFPTNSDLCAVRLPGNMSLFIQGADTDIAPGNTTLGQAEQARMRVIRVMGTFETARDAIEEHEIDTLTVGEIRLIADKCIDIVDGIEAWERGKNIKTVKKLVKDIDEAGDKLEKADDKLDDVPSDLRAYPKSAMNFSKAFSQWSAEPHTTTSSVALAAVRAAMSVCNKSLSNYK